MSTNAQTSSLLSLQMTPGRVVKARESGAVVGKSPAPTRIFSPDGYSLPATGSGASALSLSKFDRFVGRNSDLLSIIDQDSSLLRRALQEGFQTRRDLQNILIDEIQSRVDRNSPLNEAFLKGNLELTGILAMNLGGLLDAISTDDELARLLTSGGADLEATIQTSIAEAALAKTGAIRGIDRNFYVENPLAAAWILQNPGTAEAIAEDSTGAEADAFIRRYTFGRSAMQDEIAADAHALLSNPTAYSLNYLTQDEDFSATLVGATHLKDYEKLPGFLRTNQVLTLDRVDVGSLLRAFEVNRLSENITSQDTFNSELMTRNIGLTLILNRDENLRKATIDDLGRLEALNKPIKDPGLLTHANQLMQAYTGFEPNRLTGLDFFF